MYKNTIAEAEPETKTCFNPCFNGSMYKNEKYQSLLCGIQEVVSILVLMDLCIKTI